MTSMNFVLERLHFEDKIILDKPGKSYICGRARQNDIICVSMVVSRRHCIFFRDMSKLYVTDLQSSNGIFINGVKQKSYETVEVYENDIVGIGCADTNLKDNTFFAYKIGIIKLSFSAEVDNSISSKTLLNHSVQEEVSVFHKECVLDTISEAKHTISPAINSDEAMPCEKLKSTDNNFNVSSAGELYPNIIHDNQNSSNNKDTNTLVKKSDIANNKMEDDIQIIYASKCLKTDNKKKGSIKTLQYSKNLYKCDENMDKNSNKDGKDINKIDTTKEISNDPNKTSDKLFFAKETNFIRTKDQVIKLENELQITDDHDEAHLAAANMTCEKTPIKLKKIKQTPKTRFSEIDIVDISDEEEGIFPYSQLFDIKFEDNIKIKEEIKQEIFNNDIEKVDILDVDDEVVILTDSEDEDNPWLHRLSRSQVVNENEETKDADNVIIKDEIDLGIWEDDDISKIIRSEAPCISKNDDKIIVTQPMDTGTSKILLKKTSFESDISVDDKIKCKDGIKNNVNLSSTKVDAMDVDNIDPSHSRSANNDHISEREIGIRRDAELDKQRETSDDIASRISMKLKSKSIATKRLIPIIESLHLPPRKRRYKNEHNIDYNKDCSTDCNKNRNTNRSKDHSTDQNKVSKSSEEKLSSKSGTQENKMLGLEEKVEKHFFNKKQERHHKETVKEIVDHSRSNKRKETISKEEKKAIIEERKMKLKKIAEEERKLSIESDQISKRRIAKPIAKVSLKNRGDFLIQDQETYISKQHLDKPHSDKPHSDKLHLDKSHSEKQQKISNQSKQRLIDDADVSKKSVTSNIELKKSHQKEKENVSNVSDDIATSLQQSLRLNTLDATTILQKNTGTKNSANDDTDKKHKRGRKRKKSDNNANVFESQGKSDKRSSILIENSNLSPHMLKLHEKSKKKKVTFSDKTDIREYQIDSHNSLRKLEGKDAPIPTNKLTKTTCTIPVEDSPKLEEFLLRIFMWNPVWLEEQRYLKSEPPIVSEDELQPMKLCYDSFQQYYKVAQPLLLLEIWQSITKDFEMVGKNMQHVTAMCSIVANSITCIPIPSTNLFLTTLMLEILVRKEDLVKKSYPNYGDLVSFEYARNIYGKQVFHKVFAYITNMCQTIITDFTHYNKDLKNYVPYPYAVITYTMLTRPLEDNILVNRVQRMRTVTYLRANIRMVQALQYLPQSPLLNLILNPKVNDYQLPPMNKSYTYSSLVTKDKLNLKQLEAVFRVTESVLKKEAKLCFIQGPPGTGKSTVIINLVIQILYGEDTIRNNEESLKILICAPSNAAIDEIVTRLLAIRSTMTQKRFNMVRIGRPETMHPAAKNISVTELAKRYLKKTAEMGVSSSTDCTVNFKEEKIMLETRLNSISNKLSCPNITDSKKRELKRKLNDASTRYNVLMHGKLIDQLDPRERAKYQRSAEDTILAGADIIACTLSSCYTNQMESIFGVNKEQLSVCIVDEATQSCEAETLIPLMLGVNTMVLVGDPNQLPATVLSQRAKKLGLDQSVFSRIQNAFALLTNNPIIMLDTQYRMAYPISYWPNKYFYGGKLKNAAENKLTFPFHAYRVINHTSAQNDDKFSNTTEAEFVANIIFTMFKFAKWETVSGTITLGILTPYNNQRNIILNKINEKIRSIPENLKKKISFEVNTVDGFQGQERDIIMMSCVRSNGIGFLSDRQRLCVALTRAKQSLILCGNFNTFKKDPMWNALLSDAQSRGIVCNLDANVAPATIKTFIVK